MAFCFGQNNWKRDVADDLQKGALNLLDNEIMTDITLVVNEKEFYCHKLILAAVSPYFRSMFSGGFREQDQNKIHLQEMSAENFDVVLNFIYSRSKRVTSENVVDILKLAHMLQIKSLQNECEKFMVDHLNDENAIDMLKIATSMSWEDLEERCRMYVCRNFSKISKGPSFPLLSVHELIKLISRDEINAPIEENIFQSVIDWMKYDEKERKPLIADILQHVRFPLMRAESLIEIESQNRDIFRKCDAFWAEACQYHMITERRYEMMSKRTQHRRCSPYANVLIAVCKMKGFKGYKGMLGPTLVAYDFLTRSWNKIENSLENDSNHNYYQHEYQEITNVSTKGEHIFCLTNCSRSSYRYIVDFDLRKQNIKATKIEENRTHCSVVLIGNSLMLIGGIITQYNVESPCTSVLKYDLSVGIKKGQEKIGDITIPVQDMSTAVFGPRVYIFGGKSASGQDSSAVQCFDTITNQCTIVGELPEPVSFSRSVTLDDTVYVFSKSGAVMEVKLFPDYSASILGKYDNFDFDNFSVVVRDDNFWVFNCHESTCESENGWIRVMQRKNGQEIGLPQLPEQTPNAAYEKIVHIMPFVIRKQMLGDAYRMYELSNLFGKNVS